MNKRITALLLAGALAVGMVFAGCSNSNESAKNSATGSKSFVKGTESLNPAADDETAQDERVDGSTLSGNTYYDKPFGFTMTLPEGWADGVYIHSNTTSDNDRELVFLEKTSYDSDKSKGVLFTITSSTKDPEANDKVSMGSISSQSLGKIYLKYSEPTKKNSKPKDKKLASNYTKLSKLTDKAVESITVDSNEDYTAPKADNGITLKVAE